MIVLDLFSIDQKDPDLFFFDVSECFSQPDLWRFLRFALPATKQRLDRAESAGEFLRQIDSDLGVMTGAVARVDNAFLAIDTFLVCPRFRQRAAPN